MRVARYVRRNAILMISHVLLNPLLLILHYINFTVYLIAATDPSTRYYLGVNAEVVSFFGPCAHACIGTRSPLLFLVRPMQQSMHEIRLLVNAQRSS